MPTLFTNSLGHRFRALPGFKTKLAIWPVRVADFAAFVAATRYDATGGMLTLGPTDYDWLPNGKTWKDPGYAQGPDHPVVGVNYFDAGAFCRWLTATERKAGVLARGETYRLPTDQEWSAAIGLSRERGRTPEERLHASDGRYPWGPDWPPPAGFGNYAGAESKEGMPSWWGVVPGGYTDPYPRTSPVGSFPPSKRGFFDLSGNVWEWCSDSYSRGSVAKVTRGGAWGSDRPAYLQSAKRNPQFPEARVDELGFRLALGPTR